MDGVETLPEVLVGGVGLHNAQSGPAQALHLGGVVVNTQHAALPVGHQPGVGGPPHPSHTEDHGPHPGQVHRLLLGVEGVVAAVGDAGGQGAHEPGGAAVGHRGDHEAQRQGQAGRGLPLLAQGPVPHRHRHHNERELAVGRHRQPHQHAGAPTHPQHADHDRVGQGAQRQQPEQRERHGHRPGPRGPVQADGHEEAHQEELLNGEQARRELPGGGVGGQQRPHEQGPQVAVEPQEGEQEVAGQQGHGDTEQGAHLPVAHAVQDAAQHPGGRPQQHQGGRPRAGGETGGQGHVGHGEHVLDDQHANGDPPVERPGVVTLLQELDHHNGGGEGQGQPQAGHPGGGDGVRGQAAGHQAAHERRGRQAQDERGGHRRANDLPTGQDPQVELEPDGEQQHRHTQVAQDLHVAQVLHVTGPQDEARGQEAHQGRQTQERGGEAQQDDRGQVDGRGQCRAHGKLVLIDRSGRPPYSYHEVRTSAHQVPRGGRVPGWRAAEGLRAHRAPQGAGA